MKELEEIETEKYHLIVIECNCGFHIGLDVTYLEQVDEIEVNCPNCNKIIKTEKIQ